jgi:hypothetical protein
VAAAALRGLLHRHSRQPRPRRSRSRSQPPALAD